MMAIEDNPYGITRVDMVVGIPSYNEAERIAFPTKQADQGLTKHFADKSAVIINCDNCSPDQTRTAFMNTHTKTPKIYLSTDEGVRGKGSNLRNLFRKSVELSAEAVIVVDADLKSIGPQWIRNLGAPLFEDFHYVSPLYVRHKYDGFVTNNIAYPLIRALYGRRVRQPIGGDCGFSGRLARTFVETEVWNDAVGEYGIDIWMAIQAVRSRLPMIQSFMGNAKVHKPKDPGTEIQPLFNNVLTTIFELMGQYEDFWREVKWSRPTAVFGFGLGEAEMPPPSEANPVELREEFTSGISRHWDIYREVMSSETLGKFEEVVGLPDYAFEFPTPLWAKVLYDFARAYNRNPGPKESLLESLLPIYYGKVLSVVIETEPMNSQQVEEYIEDQCLQFEKTKPYLLQRWFSG
ncbi:MAG: glycosyl transferase [Pseudomonadota bacterium]